VLIPIARWPAPRASQATAVVFVFAFAAFYVGAMQALGPRYDLRTAAAQVAAAQGAGAPVAHIGRYHAQFSFLGRLREPVVQVRGWQLPEWAAAHPTGYVIVGCDDETPPPAGIYQQPYRSGSLRIWPVNRLPGFDDTALCGG
jgi:hypothetical protein